MYETSSDVRRSSRHLKAKEKDVTVPEMTKRNGQATERVREMTKCRGQATEGVAESSGEASTPQRQSTRKRRTKSALELLGKIKHEPPNDEGYYGGRWYPGPDDKVNMVIIKQEPKGTSKISTEKKKAVYVKVKNTTTPNSKNKSALINEEILQADKDSEKSDNHKTIPSLASDRSEQEQTDKNTTILNDRKPGLSTRSSRASQLSVMVDVNDDDCKITADIPARKKIKLDKSPRDSRCVDKASDVNECQELPIEGTDVILCKTETEDSPEKHEIHTNLSSFTLFSDEDSEFSQEFVKRASTSSSKISNIKGPEFVKRASTSNSEFVKRASHSTISNSKDLEKTQCINALPPKIHQSKAVTTDKVIRKKIEGDRVVANTKQKLVCERESIEDDGVGELSVLSDGSIQPDYKCEDDFNEDGKAREASEALVKLASGSLDSDKENKGSTTVITQREINKDGKTIVQWVVTEGSLEGEDTQGDVQVFDIGTIRSPDSDGVIHQEDAPADNQPNSILRLEPDDTVTEMMVVEAVGSTVSAIGNFVMEQNEAEPITITNIQKCVVDEGVLQLDCEVGEDIITAEQDEQAVVMTSEDLANRERSRSGRRAKPQKQVVITPELQEMLDDMLPDDDMDNHVVKLRQMSHRRITMECKYCNKLIHDRHEFRKHIKTHKDVSFAPWKCPLCDYRCDIRAGIVRHINIHSDIKPYACLECGREFTFKQKLQVHMKYHADLRDYQCHLCYFAFHELKALKYHLQRIHEIEYKDIKGKICVRKSKGAEVVTTPPLFAGSEPMMEFRMTEVPGSPSQPNMILVSADNNTIFTDAGEIHVIQPEPEPDITRSEDVPEKQIEIHYKDDQGDLCKQDVVSDVNADQLDTKETINLIEASEENEDAGISSHSLVITPEATESDPDTIVTDEHKIDILDKPITDQQELQNSVSIVTDENKLENSDNIVTDQHKVENSQENKIEPLQVIQIDEHGNITKANASGDSVETDDVLQGVESSQETALKVVTVPIMSATGEKMGVTGVMMMESETEKSKGTYRRRHLRLHGPCKTNQTTARYKLGMQGGEIAQTEGVKVKKQQRVNNQRVLGPEQVEDSLLQYCDVHNHSTEQKVTFHCRLCQNDLPSKTQFIAHLQKEHPDIKSWTCHICGYQCRLRSSLIVHIKLHTGEKNHHCEICGKDFAFKQKLKLHMQHHINLREFKCDSCDKGFNSKSELAKHVKRVHMSDRPWECQLCGNTFKEAARLRRHMEAHTTGKKFLCQYCKRYYRSKTSLMQHMKSHTCMFHCEICDKSFGSYSGFMSHKVMHDESFDGYHCDMCDKVLHTKGSLKCHREIAHSDLRPFVCKQCPKKFKTKKDLKNHGIVHSADRKFTCEVCQFQCKRQESLRVHMRRHASIKPFQCTICKKEYTQKHAFQSHMRHHKSPDITYHCVFCQKDYNSQNDLESHMLEYHGESCELAVSVNIEGEDTAIDETCNISTEIEPDNQEMTVYMCEECNSVFLTQDSLAVHILAEHMRHGFTGGLDIKVQEQDDMGDDPDNKLEIPQLEAEVNADAAVPEEATISQSMLDSRSVTLGQVTRRIASEMEEAVETLVAISDPSSQMKVVSVLHPGTPKANKPQIYNNEQDINNHITSTSLIHNRESDANLGSVTSSCEEEIVTEAVLDVEMTDLDLESGQTVVSVTDPNTNDEYLLNIQQDAIDSLLASAAGGECEVNGEEQHGFVTVAETVEIPIDNKSDDMV